MPTKVRKIRSPKLSPEGRNAIRAMRLGVQLAIKQSRQAGVPMAIWKNGRIALVHL